MRGKLCYKYCNVLQTRITPAHAGKTAHPDTARRTVPGSPPRMRGKRRSISCLVPPYRITPAHAGKTRQVLRGKAFREDHPRACGENLIMCEGLQERMGSPPRMRGKRAHAYDACGRLRITPAHAGKTKPEDIEAERKRGSPPRMRGKRPRLQTRL